MKVILFSKYSKVYVDFENAIKFSENLTVLKRIAFEVKPLISVNYDKTNFVTHLLHPKSEMMTLKFFT